MTFYFGILSDIDSDVALTSFILTIMFLATFDFCLGALEFSIKDNPIYNQMLQKIYKELMCMGFVNFIVVLFTATNDNERLSEWIDVIDFVGYMLFFVAIFFVLHSFYIMFMSFHASKRYAQLHSISLAETLQIYSDNSENFFKNILFHLRYLSASNALEIVEFKIIYALFRDTYWLPPKFDYGFYLSGCLERYSLQIINIGLTSWSLMVMLAVVNYIRLKFMGHGAFNCGSYHTDPDMVPSDDETMDPTDNPYDTVSERCQTDHLKLFCLCGGLVCFYASMVFFVSRFYVKRLLCRAGVAETEIYAEFLMFEESLNLSEHMEDTHRNVEINLPENHMRRGNSRRRMSINTFRGQIMTLRQESLQEDTSHEVYKKLTKSLSNISDTYFDLDWLYDIQVWVRLKIASCFKANAEEKSNKYSENFIFRRPSRVGTMNEAQTPTTPTTVSGGKISPKVNKSPQNRNGRRSSTTITLSGGPMAKSHLLPNVATTPSQMMKSASREPPLKRGDGGDIPVKLKNMALDKKQSWSTVEQFKLQQEIKNSKKKSRRRSTIGDYMNTKNKMKLTEDFSDVYFFSSPLLYFRAVEVAIMLNSLYLSMWAVNFISVAEHATENPVVWQLLMLTPLVVCVPLVGAIVKTASLLSAIAELEVDVIGSVLENMEDETVLLQELRDKIARRLVHVDLQNEKKEIVHALFYEIDTDRSGFISRHEFRDMLRALHLHYSDHKYKKLFNVIDKDRSGSISEQELTDVVFPEEALHDDVKNRSKIVNEHMEKKKLEKSAKMLLNTKTRWGRLSNITKAMGQFKSAVLTRRKRRNVIVGGGDGLNALALSAENMQRLHQVAEEAASRGNDNDDDSDSSSSSGGSQDKDSAKVGVLVKPFDKPEDIDTPQHTSPEKDHPPLKPKNNFLNVVDSSGVSEGPSGNSDEEKDELDLSTRFSMRLGGGVVGRSTDEVEQLQGSLPPKSPSSIGGGGQQMRNVFEPDSHDRGSLLHSEADHSQTTVQDF
mmetsp:Transcript_13050/g.21342  ORF Transcript_13050/g.21342 Transcript_13050/m.21342 type:complete len:1003 (-) Transcript_13050:234-3242(-)|eukprot:CAMPEP_0114429058 /NCGR_PEP_ID=MMETSP0103-20121206/9270_1 /TAXON_ID=37642 ORGANISM="Paraphysomonas imperforata, Strain PA2" /NCGR_SAMPLE_ID=MMETSP0103 /ASSEMBLY_ACC=CAM_ASM_000201 /LENGTH=1002 /DNA_ID=CAMNT_0001598343 /DNA_START=117 /DNA_END=3125 /DNA_ORIENTATION=-